MVPFEDQIVAQIPALRRYAYVLIGNRDGADDLVQSCLERAMQRADLFEPGTNLRAWMFTIQHNIYINEVRRKQNRCTRSLTDVDMERIPTPAAQYGRIELSEVEKAMGELADDQKSTILLVCVEGLSYAEAAKVMGVSVGTVRSRLCRGRRALSAKMGHSKGTKLERQPSIQSQRSRHP